MWWQQDLDSPFPVQQFFPVFVLQAVASLPQQDFPALASQQDFPSFAAHILASLAAQQLMASLALLEQQDASLPSFPWQHAADSWSCFCAAAL
jgi:hypothetical protein